jgi:ABC-2 type transport system permease protein
MSGLINGVIIKITLRATLGRRRAWLFGALAVLLIAISALLKATANSPVWPPEVLGQVGYLVLALTALIVGGSVIGAEVEDGSIVHLLATPVSRRTVVFSKYLVALGLTILFASVPEYIAGAIATGAGSKLAIGLFVGSLVSAAVYCALFVTLTAMFSPGRALATGLLYILAWEGLLASLVPGVALLSAKEYGLAVANAFANNSSLNANLSLGTGVGMAIAVTVLAIILAVNRLSEFSLKGDVA